MSYQIYVLHLIDGTAIQMMEDYDLPAEKGIVGRFSKAAPDEILTVGDPILGFSYDCEVIFWKSKSTVKSVATPNPCFSA